MKPAQEDANQGIIHLINRLCKLAKKGDESPHVVVRSDDGTHGIITNEELSNPPPLYWLLRRFANLEVTLKEWLRRQDITEIKTSSRWTGEVPLDRASLGEILHHEAFSDLNYNFHALTSLRNALVHEVLGDIASIDLILLGDALGADQALRRHILVSEEE